MQARSRISRVWITIRVYGDGQQIRHWLHVDDQCLAISLVIARGVSGQVYNVGGNSETSNSDTVRIMCGLLDERLAADYELRHALPNCPVVGGKRSEELIAAVRDRPGHDRRYAIDYRKAERELGYTPGRNLAMGLRDTLHYYLSTRGLWRALLGADYSAWIGKNCQRA